jgi:hypothetical protein
VRIQLVCEKLNFFAHQIAPSTSQQKEIAGQLPVSTKIFRKCWQMIVAGKPLARQCMHGGVNVVDFGG